jgi:hypothetical protein
MKKLTFILACFVISAKGFGQVTSPKGFAAHDFSANSLGSPSAKAEQPTAKTKDPLTAGVLSLLLPSAGHAYAGSWPRGLLFAAGRTGLVALAITAGISEKSDTQSYADIGRAKRSFFRKPYWCPIAGDLGGG